MSRLDASPGDRHCVFRCGSAWFAVAACAVREVAARPAITTVPGSEDVLVGICNERNEFLPVLRLPPRSSSDRRRADPGRQMLVLAGPNGPWALLVDQVKAVEQLEYSVDTESYGDQWSGVVVGTSTRGDRAVQVLDANGLYRLVEDILKCGWTAA